MGTEAARILAIDTSTQLCGLCLYSGGEVIAEDSWHSAQTHTVETMPAVARMLARAGTRPEQLTGIVAGLGPGSFTGLRIGLSIAKGLASALHIPIVGVPTLDAVAFAHASRGLPMLAASRAGRGRFCTARYSSAGGAATRTGEFQVLTRDAFTLDPSGRTLFCGELDREDRAFLVERFRDLAVVPSPAETLRRPAYLAELGWARLDRGEADEPASLSPVYIRTSRDEQSA